MRPIKFRGKCVDTGEWVYGLPYGKERIINTIISHRPLDCLISGAPDDDMWWITVDPKTVGQYTGIEDRGKKEIYEGDIIKAKNTYTCKSLPENEIHQDEYVGVIEWDNEGADYNIVGISQLQGLGMLHAEYEILGDFHDNPELLKSVTM